MVEFSPFSLSPNFDHLIFRFPKSLDRLDINGAGLKKKSW